MPLKKKRSYDILLGSFVALGIFILLAVVFLIGRERRIFDSTTTLKAHFPNVAGLAVGADILLAGVVVGHVRSIEFPDLTATDQTPSQDLVVVMDISKKFMEWIREDSTARIDSKGLLGDKLLNLTVGSSEYPPIAKDGMMKSVPAMDFSKAIQDAQIVLQDVTKTVAEIKNIVVHFNKEGGDKALVSSFKSMASLLENADQITKDIKDKDGLIHALVYDGAGAGVVKNLNTSLSDLSSIISEIKSGSGIAHDLIYSGKEGHFLKSLNTAALDLEAIMADLKNGKGSLGLLLKDPGIYNELYGLLGNLQRNRLLKAVIRYGISRPKEEN